MMRNEMPYLGPLICLGIVGLYRVQVALPVVPSDSIELVAKEADPHRISADAHRGHRSPHVRFGVVSERKGQH